MDFSLRPSRKWPAHDRPNIFLARRLASAVQKFTQPQQQQQKNHAHQNAEDKLVLLHHLLVLLHQLLVLLHRNRVRPPYDCQFAFFVKRVQDRQVLLQKCVESGTHDEIFPVQDEDAVIRHLLTLLLCQCQEDLELHALHQEQRRYDLTLETEPCFKTNRNDVG